MSQLRPNVGALSNGSKKNSFIFHIPSSLSSTIFEGSIIDFDNSKPWHGTACVGVRAFQVMGYTQAEGMTHRLWVRARSHSQCPEVRGCLWSPIHLP